VGCHLLLLFLRIVVVCCLKKPVLVVTVQLQGKLVDSLYKVLQVQIEAATCGSMKNFLSRLFQVLMAYTSSCHYCEYDVFLSYCYFENWFVQDHSYLGNDPVRA
jgi:hypothetical protein